MSRYIDADAFVTVQLYDDEHEESYEERMTIAEALDRYTNEGCPSTIEPKQGEWIKHEAKSDITGLGIDFYPTEYECSCCGLKEQMYFINFKPHNFCPNCGAKMKGADDETR